MSKQRMWVALGEPERRLLLQQECSSLFCSAMSLRALYQKNASLKLFVEQLELRCPSAEVGTQTENNEGDPPTDPQA
jgi:hypothetical protein